MEYLELRVHLNVLKMGKWIMVVEGLQKIAQVTFATVPSSPHSSFLKQIPFLYQESEAFLMVALEIMDVLHRILEIQEYSKILKDDAY